MGFFDKLFGKKKQETKPFVYADYNVVFDNKIIEGKEISIVEIGMLNISSGKIVVCDPLANPESMTLARTVFAGKYPVKIFVAKDEEGEKINALAKLEFSKNRSVKWEPAVSDDDDLLTLKGDGDYIGINVDAGVAGFFDYDAGILYNKFIDDFIEAHPDGNIYTDVFAAEFKKSALDKNNIHELGSWVNFQLPQSDLNITMFTSGEGDGSYPIYWGIDKDGNPASLIIDFNVLDLTSELK